MDGDILGVGQYECNAKCKPGQNPAQQQDKSVNSVQCADCGMQMNCLYVAIVSVPLTMGIHRMY